MDTKKAAFTLSDFKFSKVLIDSSFYDGTDIDVNFKPSGKFYIEKQIFELEMIFSAYNTNNGIDKPFVSIKLDAIFSFSEKCTLETLPKYFYSNSIAIVYPYIRAFVSSVTLQAHIKPLILPTMNLSGLGEPLKTNSVEC